ncbi:MAG: ABC transporter permease [Candidatus Marinimicrobia bacterium]|nr:ABC transporter permease [Candidatus Neomarinimicrobiota bacterium]
MKISADKILHNPNLSIGLFLLALVLILSFFLPQILKTNPNQQNLEKIYEAPSPGHLLGTDNLGRDIFARLIHGSQMSLKISLASSLLTLIIGLFFGVVSGASPRGIDHLLMRFTDLMMGFPKYFLLIMVLGFDQFSLIRIILVLSLFSWMETAKMVRGETRQIHTSLFVKAAFCQGLSRGKIFWLHLLPNLVPVLISAFVLQISTIFLVESGISFIGLGVRSPDISLGTILNQARYYPMGNYRLIFLSGFFILLNVSAFSFLGDGLMAIFRKEKNHP